MSKLFYVNLMASSESDVFTESPTAHTMPAGGELCSVIADRDLFRVIGHEFTEPENILKPHSYARRLWNFMVMAICNVYPTAIRMYRTSVVPNPRHVHGFFNLPDYRKVSIDLARERILTKNDGFYGK